VDVRKFLGCLVLAVLFPTVAFADIHDEFHACQYDRLPQLKKAGFQATSAADQFCIGYGYWQAVAGLPHDPVQSAQWLAKAAAQGHPGAQTVLAYDYEQGHGVPKDYSQAVAWLRKALAQNYPDAMFHMGRLTSTGKGVRQDENAARQWFQKAADAGSADGIIALRQYREYDMEAPARPVAMRADQAYQAKDYPRAAALYREAANAGNPSAQVALGTLLRQGLGVPKDPKEAFQLFRQAATKGYARAEAQVGFALELGEGVAQNWPEAAKWCNQSARQFDKLGLYCMARMFQFGIGVPQDRARSIRIYDRAVDAGDGQSKFLAQWLRVPQNCIGYPNEWEREHFLFVCEEPKGIAFASEAERHHWLGVLAEKHLEEAARLWAQTSNNSYGKGMCEGAGGSWSGICHGDGGIIFNPQQQDRYGRPL